MDAGLIGIGSQWRCGVCLVAVHALAQRFDHRVGMPGISSVRGNAKWLSLRRTFTDFPWVCLLQLSTCIGVEKATDQNCRQIPWQYFTQYGVV